jgi:hypothetical protein
MRKGPDNGFFTPEMKLVKGDEIVLQEAELDPGHTD